MDVNWIVVDCSLPLYLELQHPSSRRHDVIAHCAWRTRGRRRPGRFEIHCGEAWEPGITLSVLASTSTLASGWPSTSLTQGRKKMKHQAWLRSHGRQSHYFPLTWCCCGLGILWRRRPFDKLVAIQSGSIKITKSAALKANPRLLIENMLVINPEGWTPKDRGSRLYHRTVPWV